jgi:hypothetical protein
MNEICKKYRNQAYFGFLIYALVTAVAMWAILKYPLGIWRLPIALTPMIRTRPRSLGRRTWLLSR